MPSTGETKAFGSGSQEPNIDKNHLTVFSMRFCPYSERIRLILNEKKVPYDVININLKDKPQWFLDRNPLGKVPSIEEPGKDKPLFGSLICAEYLDEKYPGKKLVPTDAFEKAQQKMLIEVIGQKTYPHFYNAVTKPESDALDKLQKGYDEVEKLLTGKYFAGDKMGFVDLMVWPWFERIDALNEVRKEAKITKERYPKIMAWIDLMLSDSVIKETTFPKEMFVEFMQAEASGKSNYDAGL